MATLPPEVTQSVPITGIYKEKQALAQRAYEAALADLQASRGRTLANYGFKGVFDSGGKLTSYEIDPAQQLGSVQRLNRMYGQERETARDDALARGLGTGSGLGRRGVEQAHYDWTMGFSDTTKGMLNEFDQINRGQLEAKQSLSQALIAAEQEAIQAAIQERMYTDQKKADERNFAEQQRQFDESMKFQQQQLAQQMSMASSGGGGGGEPFDMASMIEEIMAGMGLTDTGMGDPGTELTAPTPWQLKVLTNALPKKGKNRTAQQKKVIADTKEWREATGWKPSDGIPIIGL